jgi:hypothetical protein
MLGFEIDFWDYMTFLVPFLCVLAVGVTWLFLAGLPGRIALQRKHPEIIDATKESLNIRMLPFTDANRQILARVQLKFPK